MRKTLLCATLAMAVLVIDAQAPSALPKADHPSASPLVERVICVGNRRNYRNFNHCWRVNSRRVGSGNIRYCSRICMRRS
ncbi:MAG: hypothetical protein K2X43_15290 [Hyphomonadaceae bacterium]|nr:hypothetical protein [Hyphomonadaceae bacterium]